MIDNFETLDQVAVLNSIKPKDIIHQLTIDDVFSFLSTFNINIERRQSCLVLPTICHNSLDEDASMKLYYYEENHSFHCYTECNDNFDLISLYQRVMSINSHEITYQEAFNYVRSFFASKGIFTVSKYNKGGGQNIRNRYLTNNSVILPEISENVMTMFSQNNHPSWETEGITQECLDRFRVKFSIHYNKMVIPHYDINGKLIGIRSRNFEPKDLAEGKYMPMIVGNKMYAHMLSYNLYGLPQAREAISKFKRAIVFEGEKSCLLSYKYYGEDSVAVATCGDKLNKYQVSLLTSLGADEIIIAFDKEFEKFLDEDFKKWKNKLTEICLKYKGLANFSFLIDEKGLLEKKDSPIDKGKEIFEELYTKCRIRI